MTVDLAYAPLVGFILAIVRVSCWMLLTPPFRGRTIPGTIKAGIAAAISLSIAPSFNANFIRLDMATFAQLAVMQAVTGLLFGAFTYIVFSAINMAGQYIDIFGGFTLSMSFDPFLNAQSSTFGGFYNLLALTLLFATNGHLMLIRGFATTFETIQFSQASIDNIQQVFLDNMSYFAMAAVEIAAPILGAFFLTEIALGLLTKAAPQLQIIQFGFPLKVFVSILLVALCLQIVVPVEKNIINHVLRSGYELLYGR